MVFIIIKQHLMLLHCLITTYAVMLWFPCRYPPAANRKYMLIFWDHGSGWSGYGVDHTCTSTATYNTNWGCDILNMQEIAQGNNI